MPSAADRLDILRKLLKSVACDASDTELELLADRCHGFVGADLKAVVSEAGLLAVERVLAVGAPAGGIPSVLAADLASAIGHIKPSGLREVSVSRIACRGDDGERMAHAQDWAHAHARPCVSRCACVRHSTTVAGCPGSSARAMG